MSTHGAFAPSEFEENWVIRDDREKKLIDSNLLNIKTLRATHSHGLPKSSERYMGITNLATDKKNWDETKKMLSQLAEVMAIPISPDTNIDNRKIPAGFTYLAQLIAHDLVSNGVTFPSGITEASQVRNSRTRPLALDTLYGDGPDVQPNLYQKETGSKIRRKFRRGHIRPKGRPTEKEDFPPYDKINDIPRIGCPYLENFNANLFNKASGRWYPTDNLLADARNDDNLLLSQLVTLFMELHNAVLEKIDIKNSEKSSTQKYKNFKSARSIVVKIYRDIIRYDLLPKLLMEDVCEEYAIKRELSEFKDDIIKNSIITTSDKTEIIDFRIPVEFSHAVFRFPHSMVKSEYDFSDKREVVSLAEILKFTSLENPEEMPLAADWIVDNWNKFFKLDKHNTPNFSRKIGPELAKDLAKNKQLKSLDKNKGNLIYRDLARGAEIGILKVDTLIKKYAVKYEAPYNFADKNYRKSAINEWLKSIRCIWPLQKFPLEYEKQIKIAEDPPLYLFILVEAQKLGYGQHLGPLGSIMVAETIFSTLIKTREHDHISNDDQKLEKFVFKEIQAAPKSMAAMINWLKDKDS